MISEIFLKSGNTEMRSWRWRDSGRNLIENLMVNLEKAKETTLAKVIYSLGIANIGLANAKVICRHFDDDLEQIRHASEEEQSVR